MSSISFYYGVMGSGKTTHLIASMDTYERNGCNPVLLKPSIDTRDNLSNEIKSRITSISKHVFYFNDLKESLNDVKTRVIFLDEAQFLDPESIMFLAETAYKKDLILNLYGLLNDYRGHIFPGSEKIMQIADNVICLKRPCQCTGCTETAKMHLRFIDGKLDLTTGNTVMIESSRVSYMSVCLHHFSEYVNGKIKS